MGRGAKKSSVMIEEGLPASLLKKKRELRSLSGISDRLSAATSESDMRDFREDLFYQSPKWMRKALLQFRREDLNKEEADELHILDMRYLRECGLDETLCQVSQKDADAASYFAALLSLRGKSKYADRLIDTLLEDSKKRVLGKKEVLIDFSQIEILLAACSEDRFWARLHSALSKAKDAFQKHGISFPEKTEIFLIPPIVSAMASNCEETPVEEKGLRSGRFYSESNVILLADDRAVLDDNLLLHELIHARQTEAGDMELALDKKEERQATHVFEALTERLVDRLSSGKYYYPSASEKRLWRKLENLFGGEALDEVSFLPKEAMIQSLADLLYSGEKDRVQRFLSEFA